MMENKKEKKKVLKNEKNEKCLNKQKQDQDTILYPRQDQDTIVYPDTKKFKFVTKLNGNDYIYIVNIFIIYYIFLKNVKLK